MKDGHSERNATKRSVHLDATRKSWILCRQTPPLNDRHKRGFHYPLIAIERSVYGLSTILASRVFDYNYDNKEKG